MTALPRQTRTTPTIPTTMPEPHAVALDTSPVRWRFSLGDGVGLGHRRGDRGSYGSGGEGGHGVIDLSDQNQPMERQDRQENQEGPAYEAENEGI